MLTFISMSICLSANLVRSQTIDIAPADNLTQTLPQPAIPPPQNILPPPRPETPTLPAPRNPSTLPLPNNLLQPPPAQSPSVPPPPGTAPGTIRVHQFRFVGNTAFSSKTLSRVLAPFTKQPIGFADLFRARGAITEFYTSHGYINVGALLPANQAIQAGIVTIQVVEGTLEKIQVTGTRRLNPNYVRSRLAIAASKPLNRDRLLEALQLLQLNPLIKNISANLSPGSRPGASILNVQVTEARTFSSQLSLDNNRPPSVGTFQRGVQLGEANLLGLGDSLGAGYSNTDGSQNVNGSYTLPLNPRNGTLSLNYGSTWSNVVEPPFNKLNIRANYRYYDLILRQPLFQTPRKELAFGLTASRRESDTSILGSHLYGQLISPGADNQGRTRISALRFFQEWTHRNGREVLAFRSQFSLGIGAINATIHRSAPDSRFFYWQGQGQWVRLLAPDTLLLVRGAVQVSSRPLVPLEQFGLGGIDSVRGYRQDLLLTDSAVSASAEFRVPVLRLSRDDVFQLTPFVDFGYGWNSRGRITPTNTLASVGLGLRWQVGNKFSAHIDYGIPLVDVSSRNRTLQEQGLYFSVQYNPF